MKYFLTFVHDELRMQPDEPWELMVIENQPTPIPTPGVGSVIKLEMRDPAKEHVDQHRAYWMVTGIQYAYRGYDPLQPEEPISWVYVFCGRIAQPLPHEVAPWLS